MLKQWQFGLLTVVAALAVVLSLINMAMFVQNRDAQAQVAARGQFIQQGAQLQVLYRDLINGLASLAARSQDPALRDLLGTQGVDLNGPAATGGPGARTAPAAAPAPVSPPASPTSPDAAKAVK